MNKQSLTLNLILITNVIFLPAIFNNAIPTQSNCPPIEHGLEFLEERYNLTIGLLNKSPHVAPHKYWLTNDNALAAYTFSQLGRIEMAKTIETSLIRYGHSSNGLIEVIWGMPVTYPPYDKTNALITKVGQDEVWQEFHNQGPILNDWVEYANLGFLGALNEFHQGRIIEAQSLYSSTLLLYDGTGFADKAFKGLYETYKLALALYVGSVIQAPNPDHHQMIAILLSMQSPEGGFFTHYNSPNSPDGDANTETTSFALLALKTSLCEASLSNLGYTEGPTQPSIFNEELK